jgi:hypothetical protein
VVITRIFGLMINNSKTDGLVPMADMLNHKVCAMHQIQCTSLGLIHVLTRSIVCVLSVFSVLARHHGVTMIVAAHLSLLRCTHYHRGHKYMTVMDANVTHAFLSVIHD